MFHRHTCDPVIWATDIGRTDCLVDTVMAMLGETVNSMTSLVFTLN
jgi:hypothetical protein